MNQFAKEDVEKKVTSLICGLKALPTQSLNMADSFVGLGLDEFDFMELVILLEDFFEVAIEDQAFSLESPVALLINHVKDLLNIKGKEMGSILKSDAL